MTRHPMSGTTLDVTPPDIPEEWLFPPSLAAAAAVQRLLAARVIQENRLADAAQITQIAGCDVSNNPRDPAQIIYAAFSVLDYPGLHVFGESCVRAQSAFPYVPGFLGFREAPALLAAYRRLPRQPDVILVDGHGVSHPRGLGIASHLGVLLDCPTIGVAKSILVGRPTHEPGDRPGDAAPLVWKKRVIGAVLRTRPGVQPVYVSVGHRVSLETAIQLVLSCLTRYRLPEPTRQAHLAANHCRRMETDSEIAPLSGELPLPAKEKPCLEAERSAIRQGYIPLSPQ